jgi:alkylresorcinol/alkylpyrone synthase
MEPLLDGPCVLSTATAVPPHRVEQWESKEFARGLFARKFRDLERLLPIFDNGLIETRYFCQPLEWFEREWTFPERNALYVEHALELSEKAARRCLDRAGVEPEEVGVLFFVSTTGISTPSLDAKLLFKLGLSPNLKRIPVWGLGCAGGGLRPGLSGRTGPYRRGGTLQPHVPARGLLQEQSGGAGAS